MTRLRTLAVVTLAALGLLAGCPERAAEPAAPDLSAAATPEPVVTVEPEPEVEPAAPRKVSTGSGLKPLPKKDPEMLTHTEREAERRKRIERGGMAKRRFGKSVDFEFVSAEHNATPGSQLANLRFELLDRSGASAVFTMTHAERSPSAKLMLEHGGVKVTPKLSPPSEEVLGSDRATYRWAGWYDVELLSPSGARLGSLSIDWGGEVQAGGDGPGHTIRARTDPRTRRLTMLTVRRSADGRQGDEVLEVHWHSSGFTEHVVTDENRNRFEYRFPAGRLELVPPEE